MKTYYEILGIGNSASQQEIKRAYKQLALAYHPDRNQHNHEAEERFKEVVSAYEILSDEGKRTQYDLLLSYQSFQSSTSYSQADTFQTNYRTGTTPPPPTSSTQFKKRRYSKEKEERMALIWLSGFMGIAISIAVAVGFISNYLENQEQRKRYEEKMAVFGKAYEYFNIDDFRGTLQEIDKILAEKPQYTEAMLFKQEVIDKIRYEANNYFDEKDYKNALTYLLIIKDYEAVLGVRFYFKLAHCYKYQQRYEEALSTLDKVAKADPRNIGALMEQGNIYRDYLNKPNQSLELLNRACDVVVRDYAQTYGNAFSMLVPPSSVPDSHFEIFYARAKTYFALQQFKKAESDCNWSSFLRPNNAKPKCLLGNCYWEQGKKNDACSIWKEASQQGNADATVKLQTFCQ